MTKVIFYLALCGLAAIVSAAITPMPLISRGIPAYASSGTASEANSANYASLWRSSGQPAWIAYDLSSVTAAERAKVLAVWYNNASYGYLNTATKYNLPGPYVIEGNAAAGGGSAAPSTGWSTLVTSENPMNYHSHQYAINNFAGNNWIRFRTTAANPLNDGQNVDCSIKFEVYDISSGATDDWILCGNSITANTWQAGDFLTRIHAVKPAYNPALESAGMPGCTSNDGVGYMDQFLPQFAGTFVCLCYGTNDANTGGLLSTTQVNTIYGNYQSMVQKTITAGKIPVVGSVIWSPVATNQTNLQAINAKLAQLTGVYPQLLTGPDLYTKFSGHASWFSDNLHPNSEGMDTLRSVWAQWAFNTVYSGGALVESPKPAEALPQKGIASVRVSGKSVFFRAADNGTVKVFDILGRTVAILPVYGRATTTLHLRSSGIFIVKMEGSAAHRIVVF